MDFSVMLRGAEKLVPVEYWCPYGTCIIAHNHLTKTWLFSNVWDYSLYKSWRSRPTQCLCGFLRILGLFGEVIWENQSRIYSFFSCISKALSSKILGNHHLESPWVGIRSTHMGNQKAGSISQGCTYWVGAWDFMQTDRYLWLLIK